MSSQRISLPGIHELFPEHLMHSQPIPSSSRAFHQQDHNSRIISGVSPPLSHRQIIRTAATAAVAPRSSKAHATASPQAPGQRHHHTNDYRHQPILNTTPPRPPLSSSLSLDTSLTRSSHFFASEPPSHPLSTPVSTTTTTPHDTHRLQQQQRPAIPPIHVIDSARIPSSQDHYRYPDSQFSDPRTTTTTHFGRDVSGSSSSPPSTLDDSESFSGDEAASANGAPPGIPRKHICPICSKAFNRPSSLKIHYNTHTGATPFRCPWPKCGREFNVNSNMRRHLRNHTSNSNLEIPDEGTARRRRRRSSASSTNSPMGVESQAQQPTTGGGGSGDVRAQPSGNAQHYQQAPPPHYGSVSPLSRVSEESSRYYPHYSDDNCKQEHYYQMDTDDTDVFQLSEDPHRSTSRRHCSAAAAAAAVPVTVRVSETWTEPPSRGSTRFHGSLTTTTALPQREHHHHHLRSSSSASMQARALTPGSSFHSSSPSPSPSPSLSSPTSSSFAATPPPSSALTSPADSPAVLPRQPTKGKYYQYSPSMHYLRSSTNGDERVSTALRPAFNAGNIIHQHQ